MSWSRQRARILTLAGIASVLSAPASAQQMVPLTMGCVTQAAEAFGHDPRTLALILAVESGEVGRCVTNLNGSIDCGPAQVNSSNTPWIARSLGLPEARVQRLLRDDGCFNIKVGAWILRRAIDSAGGDLLDGIGRYNSAQPPAKARYERRVLEQLARWKGKAQ